MFRMNKYQVPMLREYAHLSAAQQWEGHVITADNRELFLVENATRRGFRDWDAFVDNHFHLRAVVHLEKDVLLGIPPNSQVVTSEEAPVRTARLEQAERERKRHLCVAPDL